MEPFQTFTSIVTPLPLSNVDTDMIIPAQYLTSISKEGYGENVFRRLRDEDPNFPLHKAKYKDSKILVAQYNFGCGSSREHAVWALMSWGFRVVIAPSFADIFFSNGAKNGLLLIQLPEDDIAAILQDAERTDYEIEVNLIEQTITLPDGGTKAFDYDSFRKECLLKGYDDLDFLLANQEAIQKWQSKRQQDLFYETTTPNHPQAME